MSRQSLMIVVLPFIRTPTTAVAVVPSVVSIKIPKSAGTLVEDEVTRACLQGQANVHVSPSAPFLLGKKVQTDSGAPANSIQN